MRLSSISSNLINQVRRISSSTAAVTKVHRELYFRLYPVVVVLPDGSSIKVNHHYQPQEIITVKKGRLSVNYIFNGFLMFRLFDFRFQMPLDLSKLTDAERKARLESRKPMKETRIVEDIDDNFQAKKYLKFVKRKQ